jgi:hypothetical protein
MLTSASTTTNQYAQVGYQENPGNVGGSGRNFLFIGSSGNGSQVGGTLTNLPHPGLESRHSYSTLYGYYGSNFSGLIDNQTIVDSIGNPLEFNLGFTPTVAQVMGETHNAAAQMPGDANNHLVMQSAGWVVRGQTNWQAFNATGAARQVQLQSPNPPYSLSASPPWFGNRYDSNNQIEIWDTYCKVSAGPSAISPSDASQTQFWKGTDGNLWYAWSSGGYWNGPAMVNVGGSMFSAPTAFGNNPQTVFWEGTDHQLHEVWFANGAWNGPVSVASGQMDPSGSAPSAILQGSTQTVFWKGSSGTLMEMWWNGVWNGPVAVSSSGVMGSGPSVIPVGQQTVYWRGTDGNLWEEWWNGSWSGAVRVTSGGTLASAPGAAIAGSQQLVFWQGTDETLYETWWTSAWNGPVMVGGMGPVESPPTVVVVSSGRYVWWKGPDGNIYQALWNGSWHGPSFVGQGPLG